MRWKAHEEVLSLLSSLPTDLPGFYTRMVGSIPEEDHPVLICMLELVLCSDNGIINLTAFCLEVGLSQRSPSATKGIGLEPADDRRRRHEVERRIRACSGGLIEIAQSDEDYGDEGARVQLIHQTVKSFIGDKKNSPIFGGKLPKDMAMAGIQRMMRLMTQLIPHMDSTKKWPGLINFVGRTADPTCPKNFPNFDCKLCRNLIFWAIGEELLFEITSSTLIHNFHTAIRIHCGENWLDTWWSTVKPSQRTLGSNDDFVRGSLKPSSFLEFSIQVELFTFGELEISREISRNPDVYRSPKLLYYMLIGNACLQWTLPPFFNHSPKQWQQCARFLLSNGFDPNMALEIAIDPDRHILMRQPYQSDEDSIGDEDGAEDSCEDESANDNENEQVIVSELHDLGASDDQPHITIMHLALAIACTKDHDFLAITRLEILSILVEGGGNANVLNYRNYWSHRAGEATERSAIHYLLSYRRGRRMPFQSSDPGINHALSQCISTFLDHGADPNAVDSNGVSVFELALPICPYALVNLMLEKGAKVTPSLLTKSGAPLDYADGILDEPHWRRVECYTQEARVIARKYNTHWADLEEANQDVGQDGELRHYTGNILSTVGEYIKNLAGSVKRWP